ncbi:MAG: type I glyceraldehyde-3-phosphate dehydrogenase [Bacteroidetes bacterium]|nr:type I glyceraldehyde-3-phosphate dehydrogenase [Bacteroidota bacterium]
MSSSSFPNLAINGMGRIGRTLFRLLLQQNKLTHLVAVNDIMPKENLIYLLQYDSIRGLLNAEIVSTEKGLAVNGHEIFFSSEPKIENINWKDRGIHTIIEATGLFTLLQDATKHFVNNPTRVLLTTFSQDIPVTVWGVNHLSGKTLPIISPGDCTINCVAPVLKTIQTHYPIQSLHINVIQGYTTRQELIDGAYKGLRRGRAAAHSIIPFEVNITPVLEKIFPSLSNKINSLSTRVPVACGALAELSVALDAPTSVNQIHSIFEQASKNELKNITTITYDPIVSSDILNNRHSGVIDGLLTSVTNGRYVRLLAWFDNEWGYCHRLFDWLQNI